jgi:hypothetical protein
MNITKMEEKVEFYLTVKIEDLGKMMEVLMENSECSIIGTYHEESAVHITIYGTWASYKEISASKIPISLEHFEED